MRRWSAQVRHTRMSVDANSRRSSQRTRVAALVGLLAVAGCAAPRPSLTLDVEGGDAWTYSKTITGAATGDCERIVVRSERDAIEAVGTGGGFLGARPLPTA